MTGHVATTSSTPAAAAVTAVADDAITALDDPVMKDFSQIHFGYCGWTYVTYLEGSGEEKRYIHLAVKGEDVVRMEFSGFNLMTDMVFRWMVKLGFPNFRDLNASTHFPRVKPAYALLNASDVERIWLWSRVKELEARSSST